MWEPLPALVAAFLGGGGIAALVRYLLGRRQTSGRIGTSEAQELWRENSTLRQELFTQLNTLGSKVDELREQFYEEQQKNVALAESLAAMRQLHVECERRLTETLARLEKEADGGDTT